MQVSWIDAEQLKALVAQIAPETAPPATADVLELETVSESFFTPTEKQDEPTTSWAGSLTTGRLPVELESRRASSVPADDSEMMGNNEEDAPDEAEDSMCHIHNAAAALPLSRIRDKLRAIRQRATEAGILVRGNATSAGECTVKSESSARSSVQEAPQVVGDAGTASMREILPFEIPGGSREERLAAFAGWARQLLQEGGGHLLVMSEDGEVLWGGEARAGLVLSAMMALGAAARANAMAACEERSIIRQPLASGNVLTVIPCEISSGIIIHAAVAAPSGLAEGTAAALRGALLAAFNLPS